MKALMTALLLLAGTARAWDTVKFLPPVHNKSLEQPVAVAVGSGKIYAVDKKKDLVLVFDGTGVLEAAVGKTGSGKTEFRDPSGVALGPDGRVFVADKGNSRIQILDASGKFLWSFGRGGSAPGTLSDPEGVAVGSDGRVFVADTGNNRVQVFTGEGVFLFGFGSKGKEPGQFSGPTKIAVDPSDGIYVLDSGNGRIQRFDAAARFLRETPSSADDMAVDAFGYLYVLDSGSGKVTEFDPSGSEQGRLGSSGKGDFQFRKPQGLALGPDHLMVVADTDNRRLQKMAVPNSRKTAVLPANPAAKLTVSGPAGAWKFKASGLSVAGDEIFGYLPDAGSFVRLDAGGSELSRFGSKSGKGPSVTKDSDGFAASKKLGFYASDTPNHRLQRFSVDGKWLANFAESQGLFDGRGKEGRVKSPRGVAINDEGTVYVADAGNRRVDAFSPDGAFLFAIGPEVGSYELKEPWALAWDPEGFLYIADKGLGRVLKVSPSGALSLSVGGEGDGVGQFRSPVSVAFDGKHYLYVLDKELRRVSVYTREGRWLTDLLSGGDDERELDEPSSLAVLGSKLLIADPGKNRIVSYDLHPYLAAPPAVSTKVADGSVLVSWEPVTDPWAAGYRILRSTALAGPWNEAGRADKPPFRDAEAAALQKYFYRVATVAKTGDAGNPGAPVEAFVPASLNRAAIEISTVAIGNLFSANYKWYLKNPAGTAVVSNNVNQTFQNVKVTFRLLDFMDFGYDTEIKTLGPSQSVEVPLIATLNNKILEVSEDTPVQAEISLTYFEEGKAQKVSLTKPLRIYSRNAITWDEPRRIANFITPKDPPVLEFGRDVLRDPPAAAESAVLNSSLLTALHVWDALSESGVKYLTNPSNPYEAVSEDPNFPVDYTRFPRETLKGRTGQCSDLVTLFSSILEGQRVRTALLDYPGHVALMFDTGETEAADAGLPEEFLIRHEDTLWVPLEATLVGKPFPEALRQAARAYKAENEKGKVKIIDIRGAWKDFEPATLPSGESAPALPAADALRARAQEEIRALAKERYSFIKKSLDARLKDNPKDAEARVQLGLLEHEHGRKDAARGQFMAALESAPKDAAALNNLGNLDFLAGDFSGARAQYLKASEADPGDPAIWLNLARASLKLKDTAKAKEFGDRAVSLDSVLAPVVDELFR